MENLTPKKALLKVLPLFLLTIVLGIAVAFLPSNKSVEKKASGGEGDGIVFTPQTADLAVGEEKEVTIKIINANKKKISFADIRISYDKNILEMKSFSPNATIFNGSRFEAPAGSDFAQIVVYQSGDSLPNTEEIVVGKLVVKGKGVGNSDVAVLNNISQIMTIDLAGNSSEMSLALVSSGKYTVRSGEVSNQKVKVKFDPATAQKAAGGNFEVEVKLEAGTAKVAFMQMVLDFDKTKLQVVGFTPNSSVFSSTAFSASEQILGADTGKAKIYAVCLLSTLPTGNFTAGKLILKGKTAGTVNLTINADTYFSGYEETVSKTFLTADNQNGSYTFAGSGNSPVLNFKVKFQGVTTKRADQKITVIAKKTDTNVTKTYSDITVTANDSGVYSGSVVLADFSAGDKFNIFIKGPKHLAKRFCKNNQTGRCGSSDTAGISLSIGDNDLDFSKTMLEAGDLPNPNEDNEQDGVVNSVDFSLIESRVGKTDTGSLSVADLNLDGIVNWGDVGLLLDTLGTRYEDEY